MTQAILEAQGHLHIIHDVDRFERSVLVPADLPSWCPYYAGVSAAWLFRRGVGPEAVSAKCPTYEFEEDEKVLTCQRSSFWHCEETSGGLKYPYYHTPATVLRHLISCKEELCVSDCDIVRLVLDFVPVDSNVAIAYAEIMSKMSADLSTAALCELLFLMNYIKYHVMAFQERTAFSYEINLSWPIPDSLIGNSLQRRVPFLHCGVGVDGIGIGDEIFFIADCHDPVILRPKGNMYSLSHVHGKHWAECHQKGRRRIWTLQIS